MGANLSDANISTTAPTVAKIAVVGDVDLDKPTIYFDLDETLIHSRRTNVLVGSMPDLFPNIDDPQERREEFDRLVERFDPELIDLPMPESFSRLREVEEQVGLDLLFEQDWREVPFFDAPDDILPYLTHLRPGVRRFLREINKRARLCLCTAATRDYAESILALAGIRDHFDWIVSRKDIEQGPGSTPQPWPFLLVDNLPPHSQDILLKLRHLGLELEFDPHEIARLEWERHPPPRGVDMDLVRLHHFHIPNYKGPSTPSLLEDMEDLIIIRWEEIIQRYGYGL